MICLVAVALHHRSSVLSVRRFAPRLRRRATASGTIIGDFGYNASAASSGEHHDQWSWCESEYDAEEHDQCQDVNSNLGHKYGPDASLSGSHLSTTGVILSESVFFPAEGGDT